MSLRRNYQMKKVIYILFALIIFLFTAAEKSFACSCVVSPDPLKKQIQSAFSDSDAVFSGEVIEIKDSLTDQYNVIVKLKVAKAWKGKSNKEITITTAKDSAMCGYGFEIGKTYLVYANGQKDALSVSNCSRTSLFSKRGDVKYFKKPKQKKKNSR